MISRLAILFSAFFILTLIFIGLYFARVKGASKKKWGLILYLFIAGVLVGLISGLGFFEFTRLELWIFIAAQLWLLIVGILHAAFFEKIIKLDNKKAGNILFTLAILFFGYGLMGLAYKLYFISPLPRLYLLPGFFFIAPMFVKIAFNNYIRIPTKIYKAWDFPGTGSLPDPTDAEMANPIILNFEIRKKCEDGNRTVFKAKAPKAMHLGKLYFYFISDYNARHPNNPIIIEDADKHRFKWVFYLPGNLLGGKKHLDAEISISENRIKENSTVICERVNL